MDFGFKCHVSDIALQIIDTGLQKKTVLRSSI
jgi:hypothetical protein